MLSGIFFRIGDTSSDIKPYFVNRYILTDIFLAKRKSPLMPSIATLAHPAGSRLEILYRFCRLILLIFWSHINKYIPSIRKFSVANTAVVYHDKRALATCQTGPPIRIQLPNLETIGWFDGYQADNEASATTSRKSGLGCSGPLGFLKDWTTSHVSIHDRAGNHKSLTLVESLVLIRALGNSSHSRPLSFHLLCGILLVPGQEKVASIEKACTNPCWEYQVQSLCTISVSRRLILLFSICPCH